MLPVNLGGVAALHDEGVPVVHGLKAMIPGAGPGPKRYGEWAQPMGAGDERERFTSLNGKKKSGGKPAGAGPRGLGKNSQYPALRRAG